MIRTYKIKHCNNYTAELAIAQAVVADIILSKKRQKMLKQKSVAPTSTQYNQSGLKSTIIASLIKKYYFNKKLQSIKRAPKLIFNHNNQKQIYVKNGILSLTPVKLKIDISNEWWYAPDIIPLNAEVDNEYVYLACEVPDPAQIQPNQYIGIDLNATADLAVICDATTGKVLKKGKQLRHIKQQMQYLRSARQKAGKKKYATKDHNRTLDACRKLAVEIVDVAMQSNKGIRMENLTGLRTGKKKKYLNKILQTFPFYMLVDCIKNRCEKFGVVLELVDPRFTSQSCSRCGCIGSRKTKNRVATKQFECVNCGHTDHADSNAGFNISKIKPGELINAWSVIY